MTVPDLVDHDALKHLPSFKSAAKARGKVPSRHPDKDWSDAEEDVECEILMVLDPTPISMSHETFFRSADSGVGDQDTTPLAAAMGDAPTSGSMPASGPTPSADSGSAPTSSKMPAPAATQKRAATASVIPPRAKPAARQKVSAPHRGRGGKGVGRGGMSRPVFKA